MPFPRKITDADLLLKIADLSRRVTIGPTSHTLAREVGMSRGHMLRTLERLQAAGFVDEAYGRGYTLTPSGKRKKKVAS